MWLDAQQLESYPPRERVERKRRLESCPIVIWMAENNTNRIRLTVQLAGHKSRLKRELDHLVCRMSQQTGSGRGQITKTIIRDIGDFLCESVWRLTEGDINPPMLGLREVEYLHGV